MSLISLYVGAAVSGSWGIAHLMPARNVVKAFGDISEDNRYIITMEWIIEGVSLVFVGAPIALVTFIDPQNKVSYVVSGTAVVALLSLAVVSFFTGHKVAFQSVSIRVDTVCGVHPARQPDTLGLILLLQK